jgi:3-oxoadipate enol-lactonase
VPYATNQGVRIYWQEWGAGPPVLLIMGLSFDLDMWFRVVPWLLKKHRVIAFDNRGVGRSDTPRGPYTIRNMAEDAMSVLRDAQVNEPAHVIGASMGGMIAQELVLNYPEAFRSLVLACTACGPLHRLAWPNFRRSPSVREWLVLRGEAREQSLVRLLYADTTPRAQIDEDIRMRLVRPPGLKGVLSQFAAILVWSSYGRLPQVRIPTLVVHGEDDHVLPVANGRVIARRIPGAEFVMIKHAGHMLATDQPEACMRELTRFLERVESGRNVMSGTGGVQTQALTA